MRKTMGFVLLFSVIFSLGVYAQKTSLFVLNYIDATAPGYAEDQAIWQKFMDDNPDITIVKEELSNEPFHQKLAAYVAAGTVPDVMYMYPSGRSTILHEQKLVKDLAPLLGKDFLSNFMPSVVDPTGQKGKYLAELPQSVCYSTVMFTNTKLLADLGLEVPKTYQELKAMVPKLKAKGIRPLLMANKDDWVMQSCLFSTIVGRMAGDEWIDRALAGKAKFTDKEFVKTLEFVETMYKDGVLGRDTIQISYGKAPALFAAGKAAFFIDGDWRQNAFLTDKASGVALIDPKKQQTDFQYFNFPAIPGEKNPGVVSAILGCGYGISSSIPAGSAKEKAAVRLVKYLYSADVQRQYLELGKYITSRKDVKSDKLEPFTAKMSQYYASIEKTCYVLDGAMDTSIYTPLNLGLQQIGLGTKTPMQVAESVQAATDVWLASRK
ncbi:MAG: extracellular solute-binding protein [Rectinemataceae bacterium]